MTAPQTDRSESNAPDVPEEEPARRQPGQLVDVWLDGDDDAPSLTVHVTNRERIHYEKTAAKRSWPKPAEAQNLAMTFVCWSAAQRAKKTTLTYEQWENVMLDFEVTKATPADPTPPGA